jgi:hypothetical protein
MAICHTACIALGLFPDLCSVEVLFDTCQGKEHNVLLLPDMYFSLVEKVPKKQGCHRFA